LKFPFRRMSPTPKPMRKPHFLLTSNFRVVLALHHLHSHHLRSDLPHLTCPFTPSLLHSSTLRNHLPQHSSSDLSHFNLPFIPFSPPFSSSARPSAPSLKA